MRAKPVPGAVDRGRMARHLEPVPRISVKDTVIDRLLSLISEQHLGPGDRLPTEMQLSEALAVGRSSVREAVSTLVSYGLLVRRAGDGTYITSDLSNLVVKPLKFRLMLDAHALTDAFEARRILEGEFAYLAAQRASAGDVEEIDRRIAIMRERARDPEQSLEADFEFHMAIARAAKNCVLYGVLTHLAELILRTHITTVDRRGMRPATMEMHEAIAAAIRKRDAGAAKRLMIEHIEGAARHALRRLSHFVKPQS